MEVVYPKVCGVDVHKSFIVAVICDSTSTKPRYIRKRFSTFNNSLIEFRNWLISNGCDNVCMESTGKYYYPVYNALEGYISNVVVANPKWVAVIKGEKDDNKDAKWIADLFKLDLVRSSFIPDRNFRVLRELTRYLTKLTYIRSSEKNRFINALTVGNCKLDMVFSDVFGKSAQSIIDVIINNDNFSDTDILNHVHGRCKSSSEDILNSVSGLDLNNYQKIRINLIKDHLDYLDKSIEKLRLVIDSLVEPYESYISLLCSIPGVDRNSAITILAEIGTDMTQFANHQRLTSWAGLTPGCNESAGKKKSVKISRAGVYLKPCLVQVAHSVVQSTKYPYYKNKYEKISKRRGKKRAIIAIARKILVAIYHILSSNSPWKPTDLASNETTVKERIKFTKNNFLQSTKQLLSLGFEVDKIIELINQSKSLSA